MHSWPLPLSLKGIKVGQAATEPALAPTGDSNLRESLAAPHGSDDGR